MAFGFHLRLLYKKEATQTYNSGHNNVFISSYGFQLPADKIRSVGNEFSQSLPLVAQAAAAEPLGTSGPAQAQ